MSASPSTSEPAAPRAAVAAQHQKRVSAATEYWCGVLAGFGKIVAGHPFDTIKGRVQSGAYPTATAALRETLQREGVGALYQGVLPPCVSVCFVSGLLFYCNGLIRSALQPDPSVMLTYGQMCVAGGGAGAVTAFILTPLDSIKLRMQIHNRAAASSSAAAAAAAPTFLGISRGLGAKGLSRGFVPTLLREIGTFGIYFPLCEFIKHNMVRSARPAAAAAASPPPSASAPVTADEVKRLPLAARILAAGTAGVLCWLPCYPVDQVKTQMQLANDGSGMADNARKIYRGGGGRAFFKGLAPCLLRAFPAYATHMTMFDIMIAAAAAQ